MPSVFVSWEGSCPKATVQSELVRRLTPIANHFDGFRDPYWSLRLFENEMPDLPVYLAASNAPALELRSIFPRAKQPVLNIGEPIAKPRLNGLQFELCGPGFFYPGEDVVSFVFVSAAGLPGGMLTQVRGEADRVLLLRPEVHLRYSLEKWFDYLLGGIKHFHIPNLNYWRYTENSGYEEWKDVPRTIGQTEAFWRNVERKLLQDT